MVYARLWMKDMKRKVSVDLLGMALSSVVTESGERTWNTSLHGVSALPCLFEMEERAKSINSLLIRQYI